MNLYEISMEIQLAMTEIDRQAEENNGEIPRDASLALESLQMERDKKIGNIARYIKNLSAEADICRAEAKTLSDRARARTNRADWLKSYVDSVLNGQKWTDGTCSLTYRKSQMVVCDEAVLPEEYWKVEKKVSKTLVKDAIKSGKEVPGARIETHNKLQVK